MASLQEVCLDTMKAGYYATEFILTLPIEVTENLTGKGSLRFILPTLIPTASALSTFALTHNPSFSIGVGIVTWISEGIVGMIASAKMSS